MQIFETPHMKKCIFETPTYKKWHYLEPHTKKWHFRDDHIPKMDFSIPSHAKNGIFETSTIHKYGIFKIPAYKNGNFETHIQKICSPPPPPHFQWYSPRCIGCIWIFQSSGLFHYLVFTNSVQTKCLYFTRDTVWLEKVAIFE